MEDKDKKVLVQNRTFGNVIYEIPELNVLRTFATGETKEISLKELEALSFIPGGQVLLDEYLLIKDTAAADELVGDREPEYNMTEEDIRALVLEGGMDEFEDFLNFAPQGSKELLKSIAVEAECPDMRKRNLIQKILGFDVSTAIELNKGVEDDGPALPPQRKANKAAAEPVSTQPQRKAPVYKIKE